MKEATGTTRRDFLKKTAYLTGGLLIGSSEIFRRSAEVEVIPVHNFDVIVYGNNVSGIGVIRGISLTDTISPKLNVALVGTARYIQSPMCHGQSFEDQYDSEYVSNGFYKEISNAIKNEYSLLGINPAPNGRLGYEPEVAARTLEWFKNKPNVTYYSAHLQQASDQEEKGFIVAQAEGIGTVKLRARYLVDASVTANLARMLGCNYRVGRSAETYNDANGNRPPRPSAENNYDTAPQALSELLILKLYKGQAPPRIATQDLFLYDPSTYNPKHFTGLNVEEFREQSWSMRAILPNGKMELNEKWTDYYGVPYGTDAAYDWYFGTPEDRRRIRSLVVNRAINFVRYIQENGMPEIGIVNVNPWLYERGEIMVAGNTLFAQENVINMVKKDVVATGYYSLFDRHHACKGPEGYGYQYIYVPKGALEAKGHPNLGVSISGNADWKAYNTSFRMEPTRANVGEALGVQIALARAKGVNLHDVPYNDLAAALKSINVKLG